MISSDVLNTDNGSRDGMPALVVADLALLSFIFLSVR